MLRMVFNDVEAEPVLQEVTGETSNHGANKQLTLMLWEFVYVYSEEL